MKDRVLIDTSIWIDYFRGGNEEILKKTDQLLSYASVYVPKVVMAELIHGAKSEKEVAVIESFVEAFNIIDQTENTWIKAGRLSFSMKRRGVHVNLVDCYIAVLAEEYHCKIFSLDEHFKEIKRFLKIEIV